VRWPRTGTIAGPAACPDSDAEAAHRAALERGDEVVQQLSIAKYALTVGDTERAMLAIDAALATSRRSLTDLLRTLRRPGLLTVAGTLVRSFAAGSAAKRRSDASLPEQQERSRAS
jgi:hypothetical protein